MLESDSEDISYYLSLRSANDSYYLATHDCLPLPPLQQNIIIASKTGFLEKVRFRTTLSIKNLDTKVRP